MSALGQKRTLVGICIMSALPPKADIDRASPIIRSPQRLVRGHALMKTHTHRTRGRDQQRETVDFKLALKGAAE